MKLWGTSNSGFCAGPAADASIVTPIVSRPAPAPSMSLREPCMSNVPFRARPDRSRPSDAKLQTFAC